MSSEEPSPGVDRSLPATAASRAVVLARPGHGIEVAIAHLLVMPGLGPGLGPGIHEFAEEKAHPATQDRSLFFCDLRVCACELVDAKPKAWHDERGADGAKPLLRRLNLTPMGLGPGIHEFAEGCFTRRRGDAELKARLRVLRGSA